MDTNDIFAKVIRYLPTIIAGLIAVNVYGPHYSKDAFIWACGVFGIVAIVNVAFDFLKDDD